MSKNEFLSITVSSHQSYQSQVKGKFLPESNQIHEAQDISMQGDQSKLSN